MKLLLKAYIEIDYEYVPAPAGNIKLTTEEGVDILVSIDENGIVDNVEVVEETNDIDKDTDSIFIESEAQLSKQLSKKK